MAACLDEFRENEDLPNTTNPDDWARISGKKGERIVYIRTLVSGKGTESGRASTRSPTPASTCRTADRLARRPGPASAGAGPLARCRGARGRRSTDVPGAA